MDTAPAPTDDEKKARKRERQKLAWQKWRHSAKGDEYYAKLKKDKDGSADALA